jgi:hypothetical protein
MNVRHGASVKRAQDLYNIAWSQLFFAARRGEGPHDFLTAAEWTAWKQYMGFRNEPFVEMVEELYQRFDEWTPEVDGVDMGGDFIERARAYAYAAIERADQDDDGWLSPYELTSTPDYLQNAVAAMERCTVAGRDFNCGL